MPELPRLLDQLRRAFDGDAWSGPSLLATLDGLSAAQAAARPLPGAHSIGELVRHLASWAETVAQRVARQQLVPAVAADWPPFPAEATDDAWQAALQELRAAHAHLLAAAVALPEAALDTLLQAPPNQPAGAPTSGYVLLHGTAQHYLYHAGQVALLRKGLERPAGP
ncbi:DinB family protein [uncultured Hymenobacter sp.]|uniref:DinB family protein n=1 Tax=uncultured Hymenobacter sp. TaxID=170016 RepID=UPI0035CC9A29